MDNPEEEFEVVLRRYVKENPKRSILIGLFITATFLTIALTQAWGV